MKAWRRSTANGTVDPAFVATEIDRRVLSDLETCRRVWEGGGDPLALLEAVRLAGLPEWLTDALLASLADASFEKPILPQLWRRRTQEARDSARAAAAGSARSFVEQLPEMTWKNAFALGEARVRDVFPGEAHVSAAAVKKSYQAVLQGLDDPTRYYRARPGLHERLELALNRWMACMKASLDVVKERGSKSRKK